MSGDASPGELPLLIGARAGEPEALLLIGPLESSGEVPVRRWSGGDWSAPALAGREPAAPLLEWIERQAASGRSLNQSLYAVRLWLRGEGRGSPSR